MIVKSTRMMYSSQIPLVLCCLSLFFTLSASIFFSDVEFEQQIVNGRRILQVARDCPVNFENKNYSIITSQCKAPDYPPKPCCNAFKEFSCPYLDYINDMTTDCAQVMFSYIHRIGKYPKGLFASLCREGKEGLACPDAAPPLPPLNNNATPIFIFHQLFLMPIFYLLLLNILSIY